MRRRSWGGEEDRAAGGASLRQRREMYFMSHYTMHIIQAIGFIQVKKPTLYFQAYKLVIDSYTNIGFHKLPVTDEYMKEYFILSEDYVSDDENSIFGMNEVINVNQYTF